MASKGRNM